MAVPVSLRSDYDAASTRAAARRADDAAQARRLLAIAAVYDGCSRREAARIGGMDRQTLRDWVHRFNDEGPGGLVNRKAPGAACKLSAEQLAELAGIVETGPDPQTDGVVRWRCIDLQTVIQKRFGVSYHECSVLRLLHELDFSHISARPQHPGQDVDVMEAYKKNFPLILAAHAAELPPRTRIELWWQDEMRLGQKNGIVRQWARKGTRPRQPKDQRYESAYLFGAICPARGADAAVVMPKANTEAMQHHLDVISKAVAKNSHAFVLLDRAGWHTTGALKLPTNVSLLLLPSRAPELNPTENVWQYMRQNWLSNRVFPTYDDILYAACEAWNKLLDRPWTIMSIGLRDWAHTGQPQ